MKKLFALMLALMLALTCTSALATTVCVDCAIDTDQAKGLMSGFGIPEEQMGMADIALAVVNALGVRVTTVVDGGQVDLSMNDADALSLGWAMDDAGMNVVSTLFPNYYLTVSNETIGQMMEQFMANMPGAGSGDGEGGFDMAAMQEVFGSYFEKWFTACSSAGKPGEPETAEFEYGDYVFDTKVPVTVDMLTITAATNELLDELLADPAAMAMLQGMAQGMCQSSGTEFNPETFEADFKAGFEEWMAHFPDEVNAVIYTMSDGGDTFYMEAESLREGEEKPFFTAFMFYENAQNMDMGFTMDMTDEETQETVTMTAGFALKDTNMKLSFDMGGVYMGLNMSFTGSDMAFDVFFMNADAPLLSVNVEITPDGDRTLPVDAEGKSVLAVEDVMADGNSDAAQGLYTDVQTNGLGALMGAAMQAVPELGSLMGMAG